MTPPKSPRPFLLSLFGLFAVVRGYNIALLIAAQYLSSLYILAPQRPFWSVILDPQLFALVLATAFSTAAGFIINNFYDAERDRINHPQKFMLEHLISLRSQLMLYFLLNGAALIAAGFVSFKALLFFGFFTFAIWGYSSSLKRLFWISNIIASALVVFPFFAITLYFNNFQWLIVDHALYLYFLILIRDIVKDLENYKGDWVTSYRTLPIVFGHSTTKMILTVLILLTHFPIYRLIGSGLGLMVYYYYWSVVFLGIVVLLLWWGSTQKTYLWIHNMFKIHILIGVLGIYFMYK
jgi:4-hydroxybenzoate polyprenyltransferase